jgi:hypothetical protein
MSISLRISGLFVCVSSLVACAPLAPRYAYQGFGNADPGRDRKVVEKMDALPTPKPTDVVVLLDTVPEGLEVNGLMLKVKEGWQHEVLGKVEVAPNGHVSFVTLLGFPEYEDTGHKVACYPQTVLTWSTLTLWAFISPTAYPCWGKGGMPEEATIDALRKGGAAAGGDLVVASLLRYDDRIYSAHGMVIRADPRLKGGSIESAPAHPTPTTKL